MSTLIPALLDQAEPDSTESESDEHSTDSLEDRIIEKLVLSHIDHKDFLPQNYLDELITESAILHELRLSSLERGGDKDKRLVAFILQNSKRSFATVVICGIYGNDLWRKMRKFQKDGFDDNSLPVDKEKISKLPCFSGKHWTRRRIYHFLKNQWVFLAPVFSEKGFKLDLSSEHILPFIWVSNEAKNGTFSQVYQVTIHPSHQETLELNVDERKPNVAIKELKDRRAKDERELVNNEWEAEAVALNDISDLNHSNMVQRIGAISRGPARYFMFEWAEGGNLRDLWRSLPKPILDATFMQEVVRQLRGLADALHQLHNYKEGSYRHSDLKPENILVFNDSTRFGVLKIADMGLAKRHAFATYLRTGTDTRAGTVRYEPPEVVTNNWRKEGRSRLYDIWSMGCISLELIVWLLYGWEELAEFNDSLRGSVESSPYFVIDEENPGLASLHPTVKACMDHIAKDPECVGDTAMKDLFEIVKTELLVIPLPKRGSGLNRPNISEGSSDTGAVPWTGDSDHSEIDVPASELHMAHQRPSERPRATAERFRDSLDIIIDKGKECMSGYWFTGKSRDGVKGPRVSNSLAVIYPPLNPELRPNLVVRRNDLFPTYELPLLKTPWEFPIDNDFAVSYFANQKAPAKSLPIPAAAQLCNKCFNLDFWAPRFRIEDSLSELEEQSKKCEFCMMRWNLCKHLDGQKVLSIRFDRVESMLNMNEGYPPVLAIHRVPDSKGAHLVPTPLQIGLPELSAAGSDGHLQIIRQWLRNCDENHPRCRPPTSANMPTRLIDIGVGPSDKIRLYETQGEETIKTQAEIDFAVLPTTFQNAITITRELGARYLWIDSICINQGPDGDFNIEAKKMEDVFSSAYCVIAASSATGQNDGFLKPRQRRECLTFVRRGLPPVYVSQFIDDFAQHVLGGPLNKRGWVLQERALARRTIYFTDKQTYYECGNGVQCETLTKMHNKQASFLGDPNFPEVAMRESRGGKILLYQDLYTQYSRLSFTRIGDRPIAIAGLEKRLIKDFKTFGGHGILDDGGGLLRRSLLWHRCFGEDNLKRITFHDDRHLRVPSWSWMAYEGGIDYLNLPFGGVEWEEEEIRSPWRPDVQARAQAGVTEIDAVARDLDYAGMTGHESKLIYDAMANSSASSQPVKCVVVGRLKSDGQDEGDKLHYVLLVSSKTPEVSMGVQVYERVGVGHVLGRRIKLEGEGMPVKIQ